MLALGTIAMLEGTVRAAGAQNAAEQRQIVSAVFRALGLPERSQDTSAAVRATDAVLSVSEAAERLAVTPRTLRWYCATGAVAGVRRGRKRPRLAGVAASEIDAFIARTNSVRQEA